MNGSEWFTRGWTLQELVAPRIVHFYSQDWLYLGEKLRLASTLSRITGIDEASLLGGDLRRVGIARRMSWASSRITSRKEDLAYCLLGIFGVNMPLLYGEGDKAFVRLQEEILKITDDQSIFAWEDLCEDEDEMFKNHDGVLLRGPFARSPAEFATSRDVVPYRQTRQPHITTNLGVQVEVLLYQRRKAILETPLYLAELACHYEGDFTGSVGVVLRRVFEDQFAREHGSRKLMRVDPAAYEAPVRSVIYLRRDESQWVGQEEQRKHGFIVHLLGNSEDLSFQVQYVLPKHYWKPTKGCSAMILNHDGWGLVGFQAFREDVSIFILLKHEIKTGDNINISRTEQWEHGRCRCKIYTSHPARSLGEDFTIESLDAILGFEWDRSATFGPVMDGTCDKALAIIGTDLIEGRTIVAEMSKETVMGERMIVVKVQINPPLFELAGVRPLFQLDCVP